MFQLLVVVAVDCVAVAAVAVDAVIDAVNAVGISFALNAVGCLLL